MKDKKESNNGEIPDIKWRPIMFIVGAAILGIMKLIYDFFDFESLHWGMVPFLFIGIVLIFTSISPAPKGPVDPFP